jgi:hypothetical protein
LLIFEVVKVGIEFTAVSDVHAAALQELGMVDHLLTGRMGGEF